MLGSLLSTFLMSFIGGYLMAKACNHLERAQRRRTGRKSAYRR
jgi:hypothetical protein